MNLNLHIISGELSSLGFAIHGKTSVTQMDFSLPRLLEKGGIMRVGMCYVCDARFLPDDLPENMQFVCLGKPDKAFFRKGLRFAWTECDISLIGLFNLVLGVFESYDLWTGELQRMVDGACSLQDFGRVVQGKLGNPTMCFAASYRCLFHAPGDLSGVPRDVYENYSQLFNGLVPYPENQVLFLESINLVSSDKRFTSALSSRGPVKTGHDLLLFESVSQALFVGDRPAAWLIVNGLSHSINERDESVLFMAAGYAAKLLAALREDGSETYSDAEAVVTDMLARRSLFDERRLTDVLCSLGWSLRDEYVCLLSDEAFRNPVPTMLRTMAKVIEQRIPASLAVAFKGKVVVVANLSKAKLSRGQLVDALAPIVENSAASVSVSRVFDDFKDLYYYYCQCIRIDKADVPRRGIVHIYDDFAVDDSLRAMLQDGLPIESRYPEGLRLLARHDARKGSDLVGLLRTYLECDRSVVKTMRRAFISKSTCIYRLNLINEISKLNLDDSSVRLELLLVFALEDFEKARSR